MDPMEDGIFNIFNICPETHLWPGARKDDDKVPDDLATTGFSWLLPGDFW